MRTVTQKTVKKIHIDKRLAKAIELVDLGKIRVFKNQKAKVESQTNDKVYAVDFGEFSCTCVDFAISKHRNPEHKCKHILGALIKAKKLEVVI